MKYSEAKTKEYIEMTPQQWALIKAAAGEDLPQWKGGDMLTLNRELVDFIDTFIHLNGSFTIKKAIIEQYL